MNKNVLIVILLIIIGVLGFFFYKRVTPKNPPTIANDGIEQSLISLSLPPYITSKQWPPVIHHSPDPYTPFTCAPDSITAPTTISEVTFNNSKYCVTKLVSTANNENHGEYKYIAANGGGTNIVSFTLDWENCEKYGSVNDTQYGQCKSTITNFFSNLNSTIDYIMWR